MNKKLVSFFLLMLVDLVSFFISISIAYILVRLIRFGTFSFDLQALEIREYLWLAVVYLVVIGYEGLYTKREPFSEESKLLVKALTLSAMIAFVTVSLSSLSKMLAVTLWIVSMVIFPIIRLYGKNLLYDLNIWRDPILVLGDNEQGIEFAENMDKRQFLGYEVIGFLTEDIDESDKVVEVGSRYVPIVGTIDKYKDIAQKLNVDIALISLPHLNKNEISELVAEVQQYSRRVIIMPHAKGIAMQNSKLLHVLSNNTFLLELNNNLKRRSNRFWKRAFDLALAIALLPLLIPVMAIIAIMIKLDGSSVFFTQKRIGEQGSIFKCIKFQTMHDDNDEILKKHLEENKEAAEEWKKYKKLKSYDPRVTRTGKFLRKTSLDELAQIINVIKGEMSFVGPRPYLPREIEDIGESLGLIMESKPGITGLWQVSGRNALSFEDRVKLDSWYVLNWSLWTDITILVRTFKVVLYREGSY